MVTEVIKKTKDFKLQDELCPDCGEELVNGVCPACSPEELDEETEKNIGPGDEEELE